MKAMIFAAGFGLRLRPMTKRIPKALIPVGGRPMIEYPILLLRRYGIREIIINLHHLGNSIEEHLGNGNKLGLDIHYLRETELMDTGGGLLKAKPYLDNEPFIVINSDVMIDLPIDELTAYHYKKKAIATLVLRSDPLANQYGIIKTDQNGRIQEFLDYQAPYPSPRVIHKYMFTGMQILEPKVFDFMEEGLPFGITRVTYPKMVLQGESLYGFIYHGFWQDLGTLESIKDTEEKLAKRKIKLHYLE